MLAQNEWHAMLVDVTLQVGTSQAVLSAIILLAHNECRAMLVVTTCQGNTSQADLSVITMLTQKPAFPAVVVEATLQIGTVQTALSFVQALIVIVMSAPKQCSMQRL
eukprot:scaffold38148_cov20-Tisochrysis_lutea.AAC.2